MILKALNALMFLCISLFTTGFINAQEPAGKTSHDRTPSTIELKPGSGLSDYLTLAAENNPGLKAAFEMWQAKLEQIPRARALPDPKLTFSYFIRAVETRVGPQRQKIGVMQKFPWFGKQKLRSGMASETANAARQAVENMKLQLFYNVKLAYYDYYLIHRTATVLKENVRLMEYVEDVLLTKYRTGSASYSSLLKIQVELERLKDRLTGTIAEMHPVKVRLNGAMNRPVQAVLPNPPKTIEKNISPVSYEESIKRLKQNNPGLKALDAVTAKEQVGIKLAKKNFYPDFSVGLDYLLTGDTSMPGVSDSGKDPVMAMVSFQIPIWGKKNNAGLREAKARYQAALHQRKQMENNLLTRLENVWFNFKDAERKINLYTTSLLPRAQQVMQVSRSAFEAGKMDFINFIDSQRTLLNFQLELEQARTVHLQRAAELDMMVGKQ